MFTDPLLTLCAALLWLAPAQAKPCQVEGVRFTCPRGFQAAAAAAGERMSFFLKKKDDLGLFVAVPPPGAAPEDFAADAAELAVRKLLPAETEPFGWKPVNNRGGRLSRHDVFYGGVQGFNGRVWVTAKFRYLRHGERGVVVGYVFEGARGEEAARLFAAGAEMEAMPGCQAAAELVYSVTGEKADPGEPPCELNVEMPKGF